ncbi:hypothetical protein PG987_013343 [Apiospora arundinis]
MDSIKKHKTHKKRKRLPNLYDALSWKGVRWIDANGRRFLTKNDSRVIMRRLASFFPGTNSGVTDYAVRRLFNGAKDNVAKCAFVSPSAFFEDLKSSVGWISDRPNMAILPASAIYHFFVACIIARSRVTGILDNFQELKTPGIDCHPDWLETSVMTVAIDDFKKVFRATYPFNNKLLENYGVTASYDSDLEGIDQSDDEEEDDDKDDEEE